MWVTRSRRPGLGWKFGAKRGRKSADVLRSRPRSSYVYTGTRAISRRCFSICTRARHALRQETLHCSACSVACTSTHVVTGTLTMKKKLAALMPISLAVADCSSPVLRALPIRSNACLCMPSDVATSTLLRVQTADRMLCRELIMAVALKHAAFGQQHSGRVSTCWPLIGNGPVSSSYSPRLARCRSSDACMLVVLCQSLNVCKLGVM